MKNLDKILFKIETNINFRKIKIKSKKDRSLIRSILNTFLPKEKIKELYLIKKNSPTSKIFLLNTNKKVKILRKSNIGDYKNIISILKIIRNIKEGFFFDPIKNIKGDYLSVKNKYIYILYNRIPGRIYNGDINQYFRILKKSILLHKKLKNLNIKLKKIKILDNFQYLQDFLFNQLKLNNVFNKFLEPSTIQLLKENSNFLQKKIIKIKKIKLDEGMQIVHGDMNHSNLIINKKNIFFIDLEDIRYDSLRTAMSYLVFKLLRHSIYKKKINLNTIKNKIIPITQKILKKEKIILNNIDVFNYSLYRILSDISFIITNFKKKNYSFMYDLEKKLINLIELKYIFFGNEIKFKK